MLGDPLNSSKLLVTISCTFFSNSLESSLVTAGVLLFQGNMQHEQLQESSKSTLALACTLGMLSIWNLLVKLFYTEGLISNQVWFLRAMRYLEYQSLTKKKGVSKTLSPFLLMRELLGTQYLLMQL